jgi:hypothetical protein
MIELNKSLVQGYHIDTNKITPPVDFLINIKEEGIYEGEVFLNEQFHSKIQISCSSNSQDNQIDIELSELSTTSVNKFSVLPDGYVIFYISEGDDFYHIHLNKGEVTIFDNRNIKGNELVAITLVTPGNYICKNDDPNSTMTINVAEVSDDTYEEEEPVQVKITESGFSISQVEVKSAQAILFELAKNSRLKISPETENEQAKMNDSWNESNENIRKENKK